MTALKLDCIVVEHLNQSRRRQAGSPISCEVHHHHRGIFRYHLPNFQSPTASLLILRFHELALMAKGGSDLKSIDDWRKDQQAE